jgi:hypothetical protein
MLYLLYQQKRKEGDNMSANVYSVQSLLLGKEYRSKTLRGEIINAEPHPKAVWYEGCEAYLVEVKSYELGIAKYSYRTVAVRKEN